MANIFTLNQESLTTPDLFSEGPSSKTALNKVERVLKNENHYVKSFNKPIVVIDSILPQKNGQLPLFTLFEDLIKPDLLVFGLTNQDLLFLNELSDRYDSLPDLFGYDYPSHNWVERFSKNYYYEHFYSESDSPFIKNKILFPRLLALLKEKAPYLKILLFSSHFDHKLNRLSFGDDIFFAGGLSTDLVISTCKGLISKGIKKSESIIRTIEFPPGFTQAGISILSFYGNYIQEKYIDEDLKVLIQQERDKITLIIETPDGELKEKIENNIKNYEKVVRGEIRPEDFDKDELKQIELKNQLRIAHLQIEQKNEILELTRLQGQRDQNRIDRLEDRVDTLGTLVEKSFDRTIDEKSSLIDSIQDFLNKSDSSLKESLKILKEQVQKDKTEIDEDKVKQALASIRAQDPSMFKTLFNLMIKNPLTSSFGNVIYNILLNLAASLPK